MASPIDAFTEDVHRCLVDYFQKQMGPVDSRFLLAFLPLGSPVSDDQFKLHPTDPTYDSAVAAEQCSDLANALPRVKQGSFMRGFAHLSDQYGLLLNAAAIPGIDDSAFTNIKANAVRQFSATLGSMDPSNPLAHHPAFATPKDWFDVSNKDNWSNYEFKFSEQSSTTTGTPAPPPIFKPPIYKWNWQVLPQAVTVPAPVEHSPAQTKVNAMDPQRYRLMMPIAQHPTLVGATTTMHLAAALQLNQSFDPQNSGAAAQPLAINVASRVQLSAQVESANLVASQAQQQHVTAKSLSVSFQYCMVQVDRPWISSAFLENRNWFLPGYRAGALACGAFDADSSVPDDAPLSALPIAFIVVKGLTISANWGESDMQALRQSAGFGPFSLVERTSGSTATDISCPGAQIIAWFCQALPALPPNPDPALPAPAPDVQAQSAGN